MASGSVKEFSKAWWAEVYNRIIGAVVYLDDTTAECLHWDGGLFNLLSGGAVAVKSLSPFEFSRKDHKKAVFLTQVTSTQLRTIHEIIKHSDFTHCILISCVSLDIIYLELNEGKDVSDVIAAGRAPAEATKQLEGMMLEWLGKQQSAVEVVHIPIFTISPTNVTFVTPPYCNVYPTYDGRLIPETASVDLYSFSTEERSNARRLASSLNSMLDSMNIKEDVYYMGVYSSILAGILENSPVCVTRRKNCQHPASLIIVDRTLDLCSVTSHSVDSVLDKIMAVLPRFPGHSTEVAIDMSPLCQANVLNHPEDIQLSPGCLYHADDESCVQTYDHLINKSQKEVMFDLYNKLSKIDLQKSPSPKSLLKVTPQSVEKIVIASKGNYEVIDKHMGVLQQALAVVQTLKSPHRAYLDLLMSLEKQVVQNLAASRESTSVLQQITQLIKSRKDRHLPLENLLALLVHVYSLAGTEIVFHKNHEQSLVEVLSVAIFEDHKNLLSLEAGHIVSPEECSDMAKGVVAQLKDVALMRKNLNRMTPLHLMLSVNRVDIEILFHKNRKQIIVEVFNVIFEDHKNLLSLEAGHIVSPEECSDMAKGVVAQLKDVGLMRKNLNRYNSVLKPCETGVGHEYRGVLQQLVDDMVDTERPDMADLKHRSDSITALLRSGLSMLTSKKRSSKHRPLDNPTVIIFVVGGITGEECKRLHRSVITSGIDNTVIIGATKLVTPVEAMRDVLAL